MLVPPTNHAESAVVALVEGYQWLRNLGKTDSRGLATNRTGVTSGESTIASGEDYAVLQATP
jgi:hypothetical protein